MGAAFCVVFESAVPSHGTLGGDSSNALLAKRDWLDELAANAGLTPLGAFESYDPEDAVGLLEDFDLPEELADKLPSVQWFPAAEGLAAVRALAAHLSNSADAAPDRAKILADLNQIAIELTDADQADVRFRFAVIP